MNTTMKHEELCRRIQEIGFSCSRCGGCCRGTGEDANLVMVSPEEIDAIVEGTGRPAGYFTGPYPESIPTQSGGSITFERCLRRTPEGCLFFSGGSCLIYPSRPWICRTYPFMLEDGELLVFPCEGLGKEITESQADLLAREIVIRCDEERKEEDRVRLILKEGKIRDGTNVLIDGRGITVI